jgi:hypothetical protein
MVLGQPTGRGMATRGHAWLERELGYIMHARGSRVMQLVALWRQALHHELSWLTRYLSGKGIWIRTAPRETTVKRVGSPELGECLDNGSQRGGQGVLQ